MRLGGVAVQRTTAVPPLEYCIDMTLGRTHAYNRAGFSSRVYTIIPSGATITVVAPSCIYYPQDPVSKNFIISNSLNKKLYRFTFYKNLSSVHIVIFSIIEKITKLIVSPFVSPASDSSSLQVPHARLNTKIL